MSKMIKIMVHGNAFAHKYAYVRGIHLVSEEIAEKLTSLGVAEVVKEARTAEAKPDVVTAQKPDPKPRKKPKKK